MGCEVKWDAFGIRCIYADSCTDTDCRDALRQISTRYGDREPTYVVHDFTGVRDVERSIAALVALDATRWSQGSVGSGQHCAVVSADSRVAALVETYAARASQPMHIFKNRADADAWLLTLFA